MTYYLNNLFFYCAILQSLANKFHELSYIHFFIFLFYLILSLQIWLGNDCF